MLLRKLTNYQGQADTTWKLRFIRYENLLEDLHPYLSIPSGYHGTVKFNVQLFISLTKPQAPCLEMSQVDPGYSKKQCQVSCQNKLFQEEFGCSAFWLGTSESRLHPREFCNFNDHDSFRNYSGLEIWYNEKMRKVNTEMNNICAKKCIQKCERLLFEITLQSQIKLSETSDYNNISYNAQRDKMSLLFINVIHGAHYQGGIITFVETNTYPFTLFMSNFGGTLGLFVGGTIMTVVQVIMFGIEILVEKC